MMRCDQCKHWEGLPCGDPRHWYDLFGRCRRIRHPYEIQTTALQTQGLLAREYMTGVEETRTLIRKVESNAMREQQAFVEDASSYDAWLHTKPDFFCACFEAKE